MNSHKGIKHGDAKALGYWQQQRQTKPTPATAAKTTTETTPEKKSKSETIMRALLRRYTGTQSVSNFRPTAAAALYRKFCKTGDTVWDMSMGYGGRLLGAILAKVNYIGTDPCGDTYKGLVELRNQYGNFNNKYKLLKQGSESLLFDEPALDFAFTSPPYFDWEQYDDDESQSYLKWSDIDSWKLGFLSVTLNNAFRGLKLGKYCAINVANTKNYKKCGSIFFGRTLPSKKKPVNPPIMICIF